MANRRLAFALRDVRDSETVCGCRGIIREKFRRKCLL